MDRFPATHARLGPSQAEGYYPLTELHTGYPQTQYDSWLENPAQTRPLFSKTQRLAENLHLLLGSWWWETAAMCVSIALGSSNNSSPAIWSTTKRSRKWNFPHRTQRAHFHLLYPPRKLAMLGCGGILYGPS